MVMSFEEMRSKYEDGAAGGGLLPYSIEVVLAYAELPPFSKAEATDRRISRCKSMIHHQYLAD